MAGRGGGKRPHLTVDEGLLVNGETVSWWNVNSQTFEVLEHVKPSEVVRQGDWVTGVIKVEDEQMVDGGMIVPVAVVDLGSGTLARGDLLNEAEEQIVHNRGAKLDGKWHLFNVTTKQWEAVSDELTVQVLDMGLNPDRIYEE